MSKFSSKGKFRLLLNKVITTINSLFESNFPFYQSIPMNKNHPLFLTFFLFVFSFSISQARQPNVIFILADDLGYKELGSYGQKKIKTPYLDKLAKDGMRPRPKTKLRSADELMNELAEEMDAELASEEYKEIETIH